MTYVVKISYYTVILCLVISSALSAQSLEYSLEGWKSDSRAGKLLTGSEIIYSSPAVYDLDTNLENGREIVFAGSDGTLYAIRADGTVLWETHLPIYGCSGASDTNKVLSSPAIGELYGDGTPYVVIGYGGIGTGKDCPGGVAAYNGLTGEKKWIFNIARFSKRQDFWAFSYSVFSTPALADTNGNGMLEIGFGAFDRNVYLLNARGKPIWYYNAADTVWSSAAFVNVNKNPKLEMIIGTDISENNLIRPPTKDGGYVYAFKTTRGKRTRRVRNRNTRAVLKHQFRSKKAYKWKKWFHQVIYSAPSIGDVIPENPGPEIVVGSGCFFPQSSSDKRGKWIKILDEKSGQTLMTLEAPSCTNSSPALGDIDGDGKLEVVATLNGDSSIGGDGNSRLVAWDPEIATPKWQIVPRNGGSHDSFGGHFQSPVIADLDANGSQEIVVLHTSGVLIFEGSSGEPLTCNASGCPENSLKLRTGSTMRGSPAIADIDNDGDLEIIAGSGRSSNASGYVFTGFEEFLNSSPGPLTPGAVHWSSWRGHASRNAVFSDTTP